MEPYFGLKYKMVGDEHFEDMLVYLDIGYVQRKLAHTLKPTQWVINNGDGTYSIHFYCALVTFTVTFTPGVEFVETKPNGIKVHALITIDGNTITHIQREDNGRTLKHVYEFQPDSMVISTTSDGLRKVVKRHYKSVK